MNYLEELNVRLYIDEEFSSPLSQHPRSNSEEIEALRERLEEELMKATIAVQMVNQVHHHYETDFNYSIMNEQFEGTPLRVSYRISKVGVNK